MTLKVSDIFYSLQGEGRYTGVPSILLRTCDSPDSDVCETETIDKIANDIMQLLPNTEWKDVHLVITGSEPLLPRLQEDYIKLLEHELLRPLRHVTIETHGNIPICAALVEYIDTSRTKEITFSISPKLSSSGESREVAIRPDVVKQYQTLGYSYIKFVIDKEDDVHEALETLTTFRDGGFFGSVYLVPDVYSQDKIHVKTAALRHGLRYSDRFELQHGLQYIAKEFLRGD